VGNRRRATLDSPDSIGHPACGPGFSDFDRSQDRTVLFSRSGFQAPNSTSTIGDTKKATIKIVTPRRGIGIKTEEEARETS
jgi:hypothetical protein